MPIPTTRRPMSATTLIGDPVKNYRDDTLGEVVEIMIDCATGRVAYVVMAAGGFLGLGEKLFALPITALTLDTEAKCFRTELAKDRFAQAQGFDRNNWPNMANPEWEEKNHDHYGAAPYWTPGPAASA